MTDRQASPQEMISCKEAIEQMWAFIDGELDSAEAGGVQKHLDACRGCHPHYDFQKAFRQFLRQNCSKPVPASLRRRVFLVLLAEDRRTGERASDETNGEVAS